MGYKLLIVDDELLIRRGLRVKINWGELGVTDIEEAIDGLDALEKMDLYKPDIVITDIKMPRMDGIELANRASKEMFKSRFIIISAYSDFEYSKEAIKLKVYNYILKPIDPDELEQTIRHVIRSLEKEQCDSYNIVQGLGNMHFYSDEINKKLSLQLKSNDYGAVEQTLDIIFESCIDDQLSPAYLYTVVIGLNTICLSFITEMNASIETVLGKDYSPIKVFLSEMTLNEMKALTKSIFKKTIEYFSNNNFSNSRSIAHICKSYIDMNYMDQNLSLQKVAKHLLISNDYLRHSFKKEFGKTITDYMIEVRMQNAKELIQYSNIKFTEICDNVGISNSSYFAKSFKKYYGISPSEFRNLFKY